MQVPDQALPGLKCTICNNFLSYFPINEHLNLGALCGRCRIPDNDDYQVIHNITYETAAKCFKFPCRFSEKGCLEYLFPNEVPSHEFNCHYRTIDCPLKKHNQCTYNGNHYDLLQHFEEKHPTYLLHDPKFEVDFINTHEKDYLLTYADELFALHIEFNAKENLLSCSVLYIGSNDEGNHFNYNLILEDGSRKHNFKFPQGSTSPTDPNHVTKEDINNIKSALKDPTIVVGRIEIIEAKENSQDSTKLTPTAENVLKAFECPICMEYMVPPIFSCVVGHAICSDCKKKQTSCPSCRSKIGETRIFPLEHLLESQQIIYPCKNSNSGCTYGTKYDKIREHETFCSYSLHDCPIKDYENCDQKMTISKMYAHVRASHHDNLLEMDRISIVTDDNYFNNTEELCYILKYNSDLFKLHYAYRNGKFYWAMQMFGPREQAAKYHFELDIIDNSNNNLRLFVKGNVSAVCDKEQAFVEGKRYVSLCREQVQDMIDDNNFTYRVRVIK